MKNAYGIHCKERKKKLTHQRDHMWTNTKYIPTWLLDEVILKTVPGVIKNFSSNRVKMSLLFF